MDGDLQDEGCSDSLDKRSKSDSKALLRNILIKNAFKRPFNSFQEEIQYKEMEYNRRSALVQKKPENRQKFEEMKLLQEFKKGIDEKKLEELKKLRRELDLKIDRLREKSSSLPL